MLQRLFFILGILFLTSCSYVYGDKGIIKNRDTDYLHAESTPPLKIPPGLSSSTMETHYPISTRQYPPARPISLVPPELAPEPVKQSAVTRPALETPPPQPIKTTSHSAPPAGKQRYLADVFKHPEYLKDSIYPNQRTASTETNQTVNKPVEPTQQADNAPVEKKKRYIVDYFR